jgi:hypothetical protein
MQTELGYKKADYNGLIPITTPAQQPELNSIGKPYIVYDYFIQPTGTVWLIKNEVITFTMYANSVEPINEFIALFSDYMNRFDETGQLLNNYLVNSAHGREFDFKTSFINASLGPQPPTQEGGWLDGYVSIQITYTQDMGFGEEVVTPDPIE